MVIVGVVGREPDECIEITALHNDLLRSQPETLYMYVLGLANRSSSRPL